SWLPRTLDIRLRYPVPECGVNLDLDATLRWAIAHRQTVFMWGPVQIDKDLYERALRQIALLESGVVKYKAVDCSFRLDVFTNCNHAVNAIADSHPTRAVSPFWGETASRNVTRRFRPWILDPGQLHDWVSRRLGLEVCPVWQRCAEGTPVE